MAPPTLRRLANGSLRAAGAETERREEGSGGGADPSRLASRGRAPADSVLPGLICTRRASPCNSHHSFHHQPGKDPAPPGPTVRDSAQPARHDRTLPFGFCPRSQVCSCRSACPHRPAFIGHPSPPAGVHLSPGSTPGPLAPAPSGPSFLLCPVLLSFSLRALYGVRSPYIVGSP